MSNVNDVVESLRGHVARIVAANGPPDVFRVLLDGSRIAAPRCIVYLVRRGVLRGWGAAGYDAEASARLRAVELPVGLGWPARLADPDRPASGRVDPGDDDRGPDFGQPGFDEGRGYALRVTGKTLGVVVIERDAGEEPWCPPAVPLLLEAAKMRLEADLANRKLRRALGAGDDLPPPRAESGPEGEAAPSRRPDAPIPAESRPDDISEPATFDEPETAAADGSHEPFPLEEVSASSSPSSPASAPTPAPEIPTGERDPNASAARRFARLVATDIRLYNEESVLLGRRHRDLGQRLREQLDRGRETFERRFPDLGDDGRRILQDAFVQVLAGGDEALLQIEE